MHITAAQHISGILTRAQSPKGQGGYQILLSSSSLLKQDDIDLIEQRVKCGYKKQERTKWQVYRLPNYKLVITRFIPIREPDEEGRRGRYLAHSLIFNSADLQELNRGLFNILRSENFFLSLSQILEYDSIKTGQIPSVEIEIKSEWINEAMNLIKEWSGEQLNRLIMLANEAQQVTKQEHTVALIGNEQEILNALKVMFFLLPTSIRKFCSFDTDSSGCEWPKDIVFWGSGYPTTSENDTRYVIDAAQRQVRFPQSADIKPSAFGRWLEAEVRAQRFSSLQNNLERAQTLAAFLDGKIRNSRLLQDMDAEFQYNFANVNSPLIKERISNERFGDFFPKQFSLPLRQAIAEHLSESPVKLLDWLITSQYGIYIREPVYQALLHTRDLPLTKEDMEILNPLTKYHNSLGLLLALKSGKECQRLLMLARMQPEEYKKCVEELKTRASFKPWQVFSPTHINHWFYLCQKLYTTEDVFKGILSVFACGSKKDLQKVLEYIHTSLSPQELGVLQGKVNSSSQHIPKLQAIVNNFFKAKETGQSVEQSFSLWRRFLTVLNKHRGGN